VFIHVKSMVEVGSAGVEFHVLLGTETVDEGNDEDDEEDAAGQTNADCVSL
jgi:hypothetical protein